MYQLLIINICRAASEAEDGELEAGELCEDGDSASNFKRARVF